MKKELSSPLLQQSIGGENSRKRLSAVGDGQHVQRKKQSHPRLDDTPDERCLRTDLHLSLVTRDRRGNLDGLAGRSYPVLLFMTVDIRFSQV